MSFTVSIQDPFEKQEQVITQVHADEAMQLFEGIDWAQLDAAIFDRQDEVIHHFYFYEISSNVYGEKRLLTISPAYSGDEDTGIEGLSYMVRYEYPHPDQPGQSLDYLHQRCDYHFVKQSLQAFVRGDRLFLTDQFETPRNKNLRRGKRGRKIAMALLLLLAAGLAFTHFVIGWSHVPQHLSSVRMWLFPGLAEQASAGAEAAVGAATITDTTEVATAPGVLCDTVMWRAAIERGDFIPEGVRADYERARTFDYSALQVATAQPGNKEAERAILHYYKQEVAQLLKEYKAQLRIGKAYNAPLQPDDTNGGEIARVSAMICAFNQQGDNLHNIQRPLEIAYDFVQYASDPGTWYLADLSQTIPYDYALYKNE